MPGNARGIAGVADPALGIGWTTGAEPELDPEIGAFEVVLEVGARVGTGVGFALGVGTGAGSSNPGGKSDSGLS